MLMDALTFYEVARMAIRRLIHAFLAAAVGTSTFGCVAEPAQSAANESPTTFREPSQIRPEIATSPAVPSGVVEVAVASSRVRPEAAWMPASKVRDWKYIVIHHSATPSGNAAKFDREHKAKGWDELGYHFVIDNGIGGPDGRIEVGPRWPKQKWGAHAKTPDNRFNEQGIGICFVGNFQNQRPTAKQLASAAKLVGWLMETYNIPAGNVIGHDDTKSTLCPGKNLDLAKVRSLATQAIAQGRSEQDNSEPVQAGIAVTQSERELLKNP